MKKLFLLCVLISFYGQAEAKWTEIELSKQDGTIIDIAIAKEKKTSEETPQKKKLKRQIYYLVTEYYKDKKFHIVQEKFNLKSNKTESAEKIIESSHKIIITGKDNIFAQTSDHNIIITEFHADKIEQYGARKIHNSLINQLKIDISKGKTEENLYFASSSIWPTLKIGHEFQPKEDVEPILNRKDIQLPDCHLFDFNANTLIYGKRNFEKEGFFSFFKRIRDFGDADITFKVNFGINFNNKEDLEKNSKEFASFVIPTTEIFTQVLASAQKNTAAFVKISSKNFLLMIRDKTNERYTGLYKHAQFKNSILNLGEMPQIQKIHLYKDHKHLIIITNTGIAIIGLANNVHENHTIKKSIIDVVTNNNQVMLNIQASCINDDKLFIINQKDNEKKQLLVIKLKDLIK